MRAFTCDHVEVPLPSEHRFPMDKYAMLRQELVAQGVLSEEQLAPAPAASLEEVLTVHDADYVQAFVAGQLERDAQRRIGFPWSEALVRRCLHSVGGTLAASRAALASGGIAGNLAGGTHHAHADFGAGYCVFNDIAVAARAALDAGSVQRVLVFDVDVHQGDGTASIFADDPSVFTCSLHGARNFPARKSESDLDVALPDGTGDEAYLAALDHALESALASDPDLVFYLGGVDPLGSDRLGRLSLTLRGLATRDQRALGAFRARGLPVVLTLGGGYAEPIEETVAAHLGTYRAAHEPANTGPPST